MSDQVRVSGDPLVISTQVLFLFLEAQTPGAFSYIFSGPYSMPLQASFHHPDRKSFALGSTLLHLAADGAFPFMPHSLCGQPGDLASSRVLALGMALSLPLLCNVAQR